MSSNIKPSALQTAMLDRLKGGQFRQLNEQLYSQTSSESFKMMKKEPRLFEVYHAGYRSQVAGWPINPLDFVISEIRKGPASGAVVVDMGCGDARLAATLAPRPAPAGAAPGTTVHSFDLVAPVGNPYVTACDISATGLQDACADYVVFCLSLMGTNYGQFLAEAARLLKPGGRMLIAEVRSRFESDVAYADREEEAAAGAKSRGPPQKRQRRTEDPASSGAGGGAGGITAFCDGVRALGFKCTRRDESNTMFVLLFFKKRGGEGGEGVGAGEAREGSKKARRAEAEAAAVAAPAAKKKRSKHNKYKNVGGDALGEGEGGSAGLPSLRACLYKKR